MSEKDKKQKDEPSKDVQDDFTEIDNSEVLDFEFNDDGEEDLKKTLKKLRVDIKACKAQKVEYLNGWQKERADFANYKKQEEDRRTNFSEAIQDRIVSRFLTVLDSFNVAFANKEAWNTVEESWRKGV